MAQRSPPSVQEAQRLLQQGHADIAREIAEKALRANSGSFDALLLLIQMARTRGDFPEVERLAKCALNIRPNDRSLLVVRAENLFTMGNPRAALAECDHALTLLPNDADLIRIKALCHEVRLEFDLAFATIEPALHTPEPSVEFVTLAGRMMHGQGRFEEAIARTRPAAESDRTPPGMRQRIWFQLAKTYDRIGDYEHAMLAAAQAHALSPGAFDPAEFQATVNNLLEIFSPENLRNLARSRIRSELPVFVVGMPRSGTTLLERIIDAHPAGHGAGEMIEVEVAARTLPTITGSLHAYPHALVDLTGDIADRLASDYLRRLQEHDHKATRIVNKALEQYVHIGLIWMLLPGARVIHIRRDPLDTCLSCFMRHLNPQRMTYARDLEHLGFVYRQHDRLMAHWKATLDLRFLTVQYEELVANQREVSKQVIEFLGLPWDERCLRYWESERRVMTLSYDQVSKPIYDSSIGHCRKYEKYLGPLARALELERPK